MIIGIILNNFKIYKGLHYVPLTNGSNFSGLIGLNGVGKSSILEALDCFFNNKEWIINSEVSKDSVSFVIPIFLLKNKFRYNDEQEFATKYSNAIKSFLQGDIPTEIPSDRSIIWKEIKKHLENFEMDDKFLLPIGINKDSISEHLFGDDVIDVIEDLPISDTLKKTEYVSMASSKEEEKKRVFVVYLSLIKDRIIKNLTYIYVPKDIIPERFVKFETDEIQRLIGYELKEIVKNELPPSTILTINDNLKKFIDSLSEKLTGFEYRINAERQKKINPQKIYDLIANEFFSIRELCQVVPNKKKGLPMSQLSSGEKQQAIILLIHSIIINYRRNLKINKNNYKLILAVDEPESALHVSACYEQFNKLYEISKNCMQVLFATHWYGFIPSITDGCVVNIHKKEGKKNCTVFYTNNYREYINRESRKAYENKIDFPIDIALKSSNDFIQSIISSVVNDNYYNWLICEGTSDKIYLDEYLKDEIQDLKLRIVPVGGCGEVETIYKHL